MRQKIYNMDALQAKMDGLKDLVNEKFEENKREHIAVWEQVKTTNGRVRLLEKFMWGFGGAILVLATLFSPSAVAAIINLIK